MENETITLAPSASQWSDPDMPRQFSTKSGTVGKFSTEVSRPLYFEDPDLQDEFELSWELILLHWIEQISEMESPDEIDLEELST